MALLHAHGLHRAALALSVIGNLWCIPMFLAAGVIGSLSVTDRTLGDFLENLLVGGSIGLMLGVLAGVWLRRRLPRAAWLVTLPMAAALAGISSYPAVAMTPLGAFIQNQRYELSGQAAADRAEAARPRQAAAQD